MRKPVLQLDLFLCIGLTFLAANPAPAQNASALQNQFQAAVSDYNAGRLAKAACELESLERQAPGSPYVEELLGMVLSAQLKDSDAHTHLQRAVQLNPGWAAARANLGVNLDKLGKSSLAEQELKSALAIDPADYEASQDLGQFYLAEGKVGEAIPPLEKAQTLHPSYRNGYNLALAYSETGHAQEARREIQQLLKTANTAELHNLLGETNEKLGDFIAAANEFQQAAHMAPTEPNLFDWGTELLVHHALPPAIEVLSEGAKRFPDSPRLMVGLGLAYYWQDKYDDAVAALLRAADLSPSDPRAYYFLSQAYDRSPSQAGEVIECFHRYAQLKAHDAKAQFYYAMSLWKGKQTASSGVVLGQIEVLMKNAIALDPSLSQAYFQLGNLYSQQRKFADAAREYEQAIKLDPGSPAAYYRLGLAYNHLGRKSLAQKEFQIHQRLYNQHLAETDKRGNEIRDFVYSLKSNSSQPQKPK